MSLLDACNFDEVDLMRPVFDKQAVRVKLVEVYEEQDEKNPGRTSLVVQHALEQEATATNGVVKTPGFAFTTNINQLVATNGQPLTDGQRTANRINAELMKSLLCAALGLPKDTKGLNATLAQMGGWEALNGRSVIATLSAREDRQKSGTFYQDVRGYAQVPA